MIMSLVALLALVLTRNVAAAPSCSEVTFNIAATAETITFADPPLEGSQGAIASFLIDSASSPAGPAVNGTSTVTGTFAVSGLYCSPPPSVRPRGVLQVLVPGVTYNKDMWAGFGNDLYNWHIYATSRGFHTLSIDRLGTGRSGKPDPVTEMQGTLLLEVLHRLFQAVRSGRSSPVGPFGRVVYVGHSYGSCLGNWVAHLHPDDVDALVLTGWSSSFYIPPDFLAAFVSAADVYPSRFGGLPLGYLTLANETERTRWFYAGAYDPGVRHPDFLDGDVTSVASFLTAGLFPVATGYKGAVMVATGDLDLFFCPDSGLGCEQALRHTAGVFPDARNYTYLAAPYTGHDLTLHLSAPFTIARIHAWLGEVLV